MKRFLIFVWSTHEARGGLKDFIGDADSKEAAVELIKNYLTDNIENPDNVQLLDLAADKVLTSHIFFNKVSDHWSEQKVVEVIDGV